MQIVTVSGEELLLHPEKAVYWSARKILFLADLHLGKGAHFRRAGIAVPIAVSKANFQRLDQLIKDCKPERILLLGDIFHSVYNHIWAEFEEFIQAHQPISFELIPGNHDILPDAVYQSSLLKIQPGYFEVSPFWLSHYPLENEDIPEGLYNLCGHLHPCVTLQGTGGRDRLRLPCFYFGERGGILPAFGEFTGLAEVKVKEKDQVFVVAEGTVIEVS